MSYNSHSRTGTYYLVCDPLTGEVVVRTHQWSLQLSHFIQLKVSRIVWNRHRAGGKLDTTHIHEPELGRWLAARELANRKAKLEKEAEQVLEELDQLDLDQLDFEY